MRPRVARVRVCDMSFLVGERRGNAAKWRREGNLVRKGEDEDALKQTRMLPMAAISVQTLPYL